MNAGLSAAVALALAAWFCRHAGAGLHAWFSGDDLMNLYAAWTTSWARLLAGNLWFFGPDIRPLGALWYRAIFAVAGFEPLAFHAAAFALLLGNMAISWQVARRLGGRAEIATLTVLLVAYNARFANLYFDTGAIYDVLCFLFYYGALLWYLRIRGRGAYPGWGESTVLAALAVCALNSKEMAVTLPAALLAYELLWHRPARQGIAKWILREGRGALVTAVPVAMFVAGKLSASASIVHLPGYRTVFTLERALANAGSYMDHIFYQYGWFTPGRTVGLWAALLGAALAARSRRLLYAWLLLSLSIAPMLFVDPRAGSAIYICLFGWAFYAATAVTGLTDPLRRWVRQPFKAAAVVVLAAALLDPRHRFEGRFTSQSALASGNLMRTVWTELRAVQPTLPRGARLLFLCDPIEQDVLDLMYLVRLGYGDREAIVVRAKFTSPAPEARSFDRVLDCADGHFVLAVQPGRP